MPKAKLQAGSAFAEVGSGGSGPGPCEYFKDPKGFGNKCRGVVISKSDREKPHQASAASASGSTKASPMDSEQLMPRVVGGMMAKRDRGCYL